MAKKAQKGKPTKKVVKPTTKAKPTAKKAVAKPAKKVLAKKVAPKKAVAKKVIAKKPVKKVIAKKVVAKKVVAKKIVKPAKKVLAKKVAPKKVIAKKPIKKVIAKKVVAKKIVKPIKVVAKKAAVKTIIKKVVAKPVVKTVMKPIVKVPVKPVIVQKLEAAPILKKLPKIIKKKYDNDMDSDNSRDEAPMVVEYRTPSILKPMGPTPKPHINTDKRTRYTDAELKEFKELILKKLAEAQKDFELLKSTLSHKDDHGTDDTSPTFKLLEDGSDVLSKEETAHLASRQEKFIQNLQNALIRIENKTYGICRVTGKLISKERLKSVPHATLAIEAKLDQNA